MGHLIQFSYFRLNLRRKSVMSIIGIYDKHHMCIFAQMPIKKMTVYSIARICSAYISNLSAHKSRNPTRARHTAPRHVVSGTLYPRRARRACRRAHVHAKGVSRGGSERSLPWDTPPLFGRGSPNCWSLDDVCVRDAGLVRLALPLDFSYTVEVGSWRLEVGS